MMFALLRLECPLSARIPEAASWGKSSYGGIIVKEA